MTGTTPTSSRAVARTWWGALAVVVAVSIATQFVLQVADPAGPALGVLERIVRFFSYFTVQSNLLVLAATVRCGPEPGRPLLPALGQAAARKRSSASAI
ncbi:hypothetical protein [Blastococcus sp. SYSU DS0616]